MKRLIAFFLALTVVSAMIVVPTYATEGEAENFRTGYCQHCKEVIPERKWQPWDTSNTSPWACPRIMLCGICTL